MQPKLRVWAGRQDFNRAVFAKKFRESFAAEFDAARHALVAQNTMKSGWFGWGAGAERLSSSRAGFAANVAFLVGLSVGK